MSAQPVSLLCQYSTGILSPREEGGREGGEDGQRRAEGRGGEERRGVERRAEERESKCRSYAVPAVPWSLRKMSVFHYFFYFG